MINKFAQMRDSWFTKTIMTVTALSFMSLFGVSGYINSAAQNKAVIQVDDIQISQSEFSYMLQRELSKIRALNANYDENEDEADALKSQISALLLDKKLDEAIIANTMLKNKIDFSDTTVGNVIARMPTFEYNGKFSPQIYNEYLKQINKTEREYIEEVKRDLARRILIDTPLAGAKVPAIAQKQMEKILGQRRTFKYLRINNADSIVTNEPSEEDLDRLYTEMAEELMIPEQRDLTLMYLSQEDIEKSIEVLPEEIEAYYKEHIDEYEKPEQRHILQMVFDDENTAKAVAGALASGTDFITAAAANGQNTADVDLGYVSKNDISEELADVVFSLNKGAVSEPTQIADSWQIVKIADVRAPEKTDKAQAEKQIESEIRQEKADNGNYEILADIEDKIGAGTSLEEIAAAYNTSLYKVKSLDESGIAQNTDTKLTDVLKTRDLIDTAFSYNEGETSQVVETDDGLAVVLVDKIYDEHQQPREEADTELRKIWVENERNAITQEKIDNIQRDAEAGDDIATIANRYKMHLISSRPLARGETLDKLSNEKMQSLFAATLDEPVIIELGDDYIVAAATNIYDDSAALSDQEKQQLSYLLYNNLIQEMSNALIKDFASDYKVKIERGRIGLSD